MLSKRLARRRAFTLLEVMIVTGIMMSQANNYGDVKRLAYQKSCENNLRQLYMGLQMKSDIEGALPNVKFYVENPKKDPQSLYNSIDEAYRAMLVCPVFPPSIKDTGCTYLFNDELAGQSLDTVAKPDKTWLLVELNAVSDKVPMPHPGGFHILYASGRIEVTKTIPQVFIDMQKKIEAEKGKRTTPPDGSAGTGEAPPKPKPAPPAKSDRGDPLKRAGSIAGGASAGSEE